MKKSLPLFFLLVTLIGGSCFLPATAQTLPDIAQKYMTALQNLSRNCDMRYVTSIQTAGSPTVESKGRFAVQGTNYYDSSSNRFFLRNDKWILHADHVGKRISVLYLPKWQEQMGKNVELISSNMLLPNNDPSNFSNFKTEPIGQDSIVVSFSCAASSGVALNMKLFYKKGSFVPGRYSGTLVSNSEPEVLNGQSIAGPKSTCVFACFDIQPQASKAIFDDSRLILVQGKKAQLRRYNDYKTYQRSN